VLEHSSSGIGDTMYFPTPGPIYWAAKQAGDPANIANTGIIYTKDVAGVTELFYEDDAGNVTQITSGGIPPGVDSLQLSYNAGQTIDNNVAELNITNLVASGFDFSIDLDGADVLKANTGADTLEFMAGVAIVTRGALNLGVTNPITFGVATRNIVDTGVDLHIVNTTALGDILINSTVLIEKQLSGVTREVIDATSYTSTVLADSTAFDIDTYSQTLGNRSVIRLHKSHQDTVGMTTTLTDEYLGRIRFMGTNSSSVFADGACIHANQNGAAGVTYCPTDLTLHGCSSTGTNEGQLCLCEDYSSAFQASATNTQLYISSYSANDAHVANLRFKKSASDTIGTNVATIDTEICGLIEFYGINNVPAENLLANIRVRQYGATDAQLGGSMSLETYVRAGAVNTDQLVLNSDGHITTNWAIVDPAADIASLDIVTTGSQTGAGSVRGVYVYPTQTLNNVATGFDAFYANMSGATYTSFANAYGFRAVMDGVYPAGTAMAAANLQGDGRTAELCNNLYAGEFTGDVLITGKLTVTGAIDPTCLILNEQASIPIAAVGGTGTIYTKSDAPTTLWFADDTGDEYQVANPHPDRYFEINVVESGTALTVADGIVGVTIPDDMNGYIIDDARVSATVAGVTSGSNDFQVRRQRAGAAVDMLSTEVTLAYGDYTVADGVIDADNDDVNTGDMIYVDCNAISGTAANGVTLVLKFVYEG